MSSITINRDPSKPFSAFEYAFDIVRAAKDKTSMTGAINIIMTGFNDYESNAISALMMHSYFIASGNKMKDREPDVHVIKKNNVAFLNSYYEGIGEVRALRLESEKRTELSFPAHDEKSFPAYRMEEVLRKTGAQLINSGPIFGQKDKGSNLYEAFFFSMPIMASYALSVFAPLLYAHGHDYSDAISTCRDGIEVNPGVKVPAVVIKKEAIDDFRKAESAIISENLKGSQHRR